MSKGYSFPKNIKSLVYTVLGIVDAFYFKEQVEMFVDAIEASANNRPVRISVATRELTDTEDIIKLKEKRKRANVGKR